MPIETQTNSPVVADHLISYPHSFVKATGNVVSAIFLSQLLSLSKNATETDGWISKSMKEWEELTGLRRHEQETARKNLQAINLLEEDVRGMPGKLCFRLKHDEIARLLPEANQYVENGKLVSNLVFSPDGVGKNTAENSVNQFAENNKSLEDKACEAESHLQTLEKKINWHMTLPKIQADFNRLESSIGFVKNQITKLNEQEGGKKSQLDWMMYMLIGVFGMVFLILVLCFVIWWSQPSYQNYMPSKQAVPTNSIPQNRK